MERLLEYYYPQPRAYPSTLLLPYGVSIFNIYRLYNVHGVFVGIK
jgi:hypothetical protein